MSIDDVLFRHLGDSFQWRTSASFPDRRVVRGLTIELEAERARSPADYYVLLCLSDAYLMLGDYEAALQVCPVPSIQQKWTLLANRRINLMALADERCTSRELLALFSKRITRFGVENLDMVASVVDILLSDWECQTHESITSYFIERYPRTLMPHSLFNGTFFAKPALGIVDFYDFGSMGDLESLVGEFSRNAENIVRQERGLPRIGEGWLAETRLYHELRDEFSSLFQIIHHASPQWLGLQHLDIFFPEMNLAIEYQGLQHDQPVDYFGGVSAFEQQKLRDHKKRMVCRRHGVEVLYVREGYDLNGLIMEIRRRATQSCGVDAGALRSDERT